ncbi:MAG: ankyrin repeat domain-containing protein, partial [Planctomycetota bacterium]
MLQNVGMNLSDIEQFIEVACSMHCASFDRDHSSVFKSACQMLTDKPELGDGNLVTAAITGNTDRVKELLAGEPESAKATFAPRDWTALLYLCFSRFLRDSNEARNTAILECARLLLDAGADPNAYFMLGEERETALYAACGVVNNAQLAEMLLAAGADVNDGDASYHVAEFDTYDCIRVLFEHGMDENHRATVLLRKLDFEEPVGVRTI